MSMPPAGFILVDKPSGWTSHDVVAKVRNLARIKKVGHAGTLDPMATGLLVLAVGKATRLLKYVQGAAKEYHATACFGVATDSLDADGAVLSRTPLPVGADEVAEAMQRFVGAIHQVPPMVSAIKVDGRRLYDLARSGEEVEREARPVTIHEFELLDFAPGDYPEVSFRVVCSTGTYVRTLADDLAGAFGGRAHLTALRRTRNGALDVDDAYRIDDLVALAADNRLLDTVHAPADVLRPIPSVTVDDKTAVGVRNGMVFTSGAFPDASPDAELLCVLDGAGDMLALYRQSGASARPEVVVVA